MLVSLTVCSLRTQVFIRSLKSILITRAHNYFPHFWSTHFFVHSEMFSYGHLANIGTVRLMQSQARSCTCCFWRCTASRCCHIWFLQCHRIKFYFVTIYSSCSDFVLYTKDCGCHDIPINLNLRSSLSFYLRVGLYYSKVFLHLFAVLIM